MVRKSRRRRPPTPTRRTLPRFLLDKFSPSDIANWRGSADAELAYANRVYFHLEAERGLHAEAIRAALSSAKPKALHIDGWTRIVDYRYSLEPLSATGSLRKSGRFNIGRDIEPSRYPSFAALYLAEDYETAFAEKFGGPARARRASMSGTEFALRKPASFTSIRLNGQLFQLFDLTSGGNLRGFVKIIAQFKLTDELLALAREAGIGKPYIIETVRQLKAQLLANDWRRCPVQFGIPSNSQVFGRLLHDAGFEGLHYQSVRGPGRCVALFPEKLARSDSFLELTDPAPEGVRFHRLDAGTWQVLTSDS